MSWAAAYSLDTSPFEWVDLPNVNRTPGAPRFGAAQDLDENNIVHETNFGVRHVYRVFTRNTWRLTFRITETQLATWRAMHDAVDGELIPFYFRIGDAYLYCRKEAGFQPQQLTEMADDPLYDYTITLTEEFVATDF